MSRSTRDSVLFNGLTYATRLIPSKWFTMRKMQFQPWQWIQIGFTETLTYSFRDADFSYINPIFPLAVGEFNNQDRDNPIWYLDGLVRPVRGLELFAGVGLDDTNKISDIWKKTGKRSSPDGVFSYQIGAKYAYKTGTQLGVEYLQIDPFFHTHWQDLNRYDHFDRPLGPLIGPNSDKWTASITQWFPRRTWINFKISRNRKGYNVLDENGNLSKNVGGNLQVPQVFSITPIFLDGNVQKWNQIVINAGFEPFRGIAITLNYEKGKFNAFERLVGLRVFRY